MESSRTGAVFCSRMDSDVPWTSPCSLDTDWFHEESEPLIPVQNRKGFYGWDFFFNVLFWFLGGFILFFSLIQSMLATLFCL